MKMGEPQAKIILQMLGIEVVENDNGSQRNMPDFRANDGSFIEVTHTNHNRDKNPTAFEKEALDPCEACKKENEAWQAYLRLDRGDYKNFDKDNDLVKRHYGVDLKCPEKTDMENNVDHRSFEFGVDNIINKINEKNEKHKNKENISLFCFITEDEMNNLLYILDRERHDSDIKSFLNHILSTNFKSVYLCEYCFEKNPPDCYNTINPRLLGFQKKPDSSLALIVKNIPK